VSSLGWVVHRLLYDVRTVGDGVKRRRDALSWKRTRQWSCYDDSPVGITRGGGAEEDKGDSAERN